MYLSYTILTRTNILCYELSYFKELYLRMTIVTQEYRNLRTITLSKRAQRWAQLISLCESKVSGYCPLVLTLVKALSDSSVVYLYISSILIYIEVEKRVQKVPHFHQLLHFCVIEGYKKYPILSEMCILKLT